MRQPDRHALLEIHSDEKIYLTALHDGTPMNGPSVSLLFLPDLHHYYGRGGRFFPFWADGKISACD
jgi:hypothetical protein